MMPSDFLFKYIFIYVPPEVHFIILFIRIARFIFLSREKFDTFVKNVINRSLVRSTVLYNPALRDNRYVQRRNVLISRWTRFDWLGISL